MKVSMSNKEYSKIRKHFKTMFKYGNLTKEVCEGEEYLNFEKEENKRKEARYFAKNCLKTMKDNSYLTECKRKIDVYKTKLFSFVERRKQLKKYVEELFKNKKIDWETLSIFSNCDIYDLDKRYWMIPMSKIEKYNSFKDFFSATVEYQKTVEDVLLELRRLTCDFSILLKKMEMEVEIITKKIPKLTEKRREDDTKKEARCEARKRAEQAEMEKLSEKEKMFEIKYQVKVQARKLEEKFSKYRYYQDKKSR